MKKQEETPTYLYGKVALGNIREQFWDLLNEHENLTPEGCAEFAGIVSLVNVQTKKSFSFDIPYSLAIHWAEQQFESTRKSVARATIRDAAIKDALVLFPELSQDDLKTLLHVSSGYIKKIQEQVLAKASAPTKGSKVISDKYGPGTVLNVEDKIYNKRKDKLLTIEYDRNSPGGKKGSVVKSYYNTGNILHVTTSASFHDELVQALLKRQNQTYFVSILGRTDQAAVWKLSFANMIDINYVSKKYVLDAPIKIKKTRKSKVKQELPKNNEDKYQELTNIDKAIALSQMSESKENFEQLQAKVTDLELKLNQLNAAKPKKKRRSLGKAVKSFRIRNPLYMKPTREVRNEQVTRGA